MCLNHWWYNIKVSIGSSTYFDITDFHNFLVIGIIIRVANHVHRRRRGQIQQKQPNGWKSSRPRVPINVAKFSFKHLFQRLRNESDQQIGEQTGRGSPTKPRISLATPRFPIIENKLKILAAVLTFVIIIVVMFESVVVVEAGHRGVVLYVGMWVQLKTVY